MTSSLSGPARRRSAPRCRSRGSCGRSSPGTSHSRRAASTLLPPLSSSASTMASHSIDSRGASIRLAGRPALGRQVPRLRSRRPGASPRPCGARRRAGPTLPGQRLCVSTRIASGEMLRALPWVIRASRCGASSATSSTWWRSGGTTTVRGKQASSRPARGGGSPAGGARWRRPTAGRRRSTRGRAPAARSTRPSAAARQPVDVGEHQRAAARPRAPRPPPPPSPARRPRRRGRAAARPASGAGGRPGPPSPGPIPAPPRARATPARAGGGPPPRSTWSRPPRSPPRSTAAWAAAARRLRRRGSRADQLDVEDAADDAAAADRRPDVHARRASARQVDEQRVPSPVGERLARLGQQLLLVGGVEQLAGPVVHHQQVVAERRGPARGCAGRRPGSR